MILDCVGSSFWEKNIKVLAVDGRWVLYGTLGGGNVEGNLLGGLLKKRGSLIATTLKHRPLEVNYPEKKNTSRVTLRSLTGEHSLILGFLRF